MCWDLPNPPGKQCYSQGKCHRNTTKSLKSESKYHQDKPKKNMNLNHQSHQPPCLLRLWLEREMALVEPTVALDRPPMTIRPLGGAKGVLWGWMSFFDVFAVCCFINFSICVFLLQKLWVCIFCARESFSSWSTCSMIPFISCYSSWCVFFDMRFSQN